MRRKTSKNKVNESTNLCPPKAKVVSSTLAECTNESPQKQTQVVDIPEGFEVVPRLEVIDFRHKLTLVIRPIYGKLFENYLKSRRSVNGSARTA